MSDSVFPILPGLAWDIKKTPQFFTKTQRSASGLEVRLSFSGVPLWNFELAYEFLREDASFAELSDLLGFFCACGGDFDDWLFTDPSDCQAVDQQFGTGDGATKDFQLGRYFGSFFEPISNVNALTNIKMAGTETTAFTIVDGLVSFTSPPAAGAALTWNGSYYFRCRFTDPQQEYQNFASKLWELQSCSFVGRLGFRPAITLL